MNFFCACVKLLCSFFQTLERQSLEQQSLEQQAFDRRQQYLRWQDRTRLHPILVEKALALIQKAENVLRMKQKNVEPETVKDILEKLAHAKDRAHSGPGYAISYVDNLIKANPTIFGCVD